MVKTMDDISITFCVCVCVSLCGHHFDQEFNKRMQSGEKRFSDTFTVIFEWSALTIKGSTCQPSRAEKKMLSYKLIRNILLEFAFSTVIRGHFLSLSQNREKSIENFWFCFRLYLNHFRLLSAISAHKFLQ